MIKKIILLTGFVAVVLMLLEPIAGVTNNTSGSTATASISETISVTLSGGIVFTNLIPGSPNQSATNNLTITIDPTTNVVTNITQRADATFECTGGGCGVGTDNFTISNLSYADNPTLDASLDMSVVYTPGLFANWTNIPKPPGVSQVRYSDYWLDVPSGQTAGTYQTSLYINVSK